MQNKAFLPAGDKYIKYKIDLLSWSPTKDFLALSSKAGELLLYRLVDLERVWLHPLPEESVRISSICWRPDGKVIAVSYNNKKYGIHFVYMEKAQIVWKIKMTHDQIKILEWKQLQEDSKTHCANDMLNSLTISDYIPKLPQLPSESELSGQDLTNVLGDCGFHVLLVLNASASLTWLAYGIYPILEITFTSLNLPGSFLNASMSPCFEYLSVVTSDDNTSCQNISLFQIKKLSTDINIFDNVAKKMVQIQFTLLYLAEVLECMRESCESALQETGSKLTNFLKSNCESNTIGDDFIQLLMWGKATEVLKDLFGNRMTKQEINKIGTQTESVYTKVQQYIIVNMQIAVNTLFYHLTEIQGIISDSDSSSILPIQQELLDESMQLAGTFLLKSNEMLQVIDQSLQTFKAFFSVVVYINAEISRGSSIKSCTDENDGVTAQDETKNFKVEKVFQYLENKPLSYVMDSSGNDWNKFVDATLSVASTQLILKPDESASLQQLFEKLNNHIYKLSHSISYPLSSDLKMITIEPFYLPMSLHQPKCDLWFQNEEKSLESDCYGEKSYNICIIFSSTSSCEQLLFVSSSIKNRNFDPSKAVLLHFSNKDQPTRSVTALTYYNNKIFTILLNEKDNCDDVLDKIWLAQVSTLPVLNANKEHGIPAAKNNDRKLFLEEIQEIDAFSFIGHRRLLDGRMKANKVSTSGTREVSCVLSEDQQYICAYEMDQREEESENSGEMEDVE